MNRLVVISNRVADLRKTTQTGGLAVGLADAVKERGGVWFGWNGRKLKEPGEPKVDRIGKVTQISLALTPEDYADYYLGYANRVPVAALPLSARPRRFPAAFLDGYRRVNERFADPSCRFLKPDDVVWVHDYHLIPLRPQLRQRGLPEPHRLFSPHPLSAAADLLARFPTTSGWCARCSPTT